MDFLIFREPLNAWTHCSWLLLSIPGTIYLLHKSQGEPAKQLSLLIFGLSLALCYLGSTLYHGVRAEEGPVQLFATLDYIGIFLLIAGSYTPTSMILRGPWRWGTLTLVWILAAAGIGIRATSLPIHPMVSTILYLVMGWGVVVCYFEMARTISHRALFPVVMGGLFYSAGAILNLVGEPILWLSAHEFMHLCVMAGSLAHYWFMLYAVVPFERELGLAPDPVLPPEGKVEFDPGLAPIQTGG